MQTKVPSRLTFNGFDPVEMADRITQSREEQQLLLFKQFSPQQAVQVFEFLPFDVQANIVEQLEPSQASDLLSIMSPDDRTAFLERLSPNIASALVRLMPPDERTIALSLLGYDKDSIGRLMTTDYIAVKGKWNVMEVLDYIRMYGHDSETISYIYVINDHFQLVDDIRIREFLFAPLDKTVGAICDNKFIALSVDDTFEKAIQVFTHHGRRALPVIDSQGVLLGIVTADDVLQLMNAENTKDIQKIGGTQALEYPYLETGFLELMKKRASWLVVLFFGELLTATAMGYFEDEIKKAVVLTLFLPLIISSGGNSGSQASTLIVRALAVGEIVFSDWWRIMRREIFSGLFLGTLLGTIGFLRISLWSTFSDIYGPSWLSLGATIFIALLGVVLWGTLAGAMLPLLLKRLDVDPATASAPLVATLVDVTGIIIYFVSAALLFKELIL